MFFPYRFDPGIAALVRPLGVRADRDGVLVDAQRLTASFGLLNLQVPLDNISSAEPTGPYRWYRALGARLSAADHGLTFGTTATQGVCIRFKNPIERVIGPWAHPGLTVTVDDPAGLATLVNERVA